MRLIVTGKSRSGKTTAIDRLRRTALQTTWAHVLVADGKHDRLARAAGGSRLCVRTNVDPADVARALTETAARLTTRYAALTAQGLTAAPDDAPRELLIIDEIQVYTRHAKVGKATREAIITIFEKSAALGDLVIVSSQRSTGAIPPSARINANAELHLLGAGYFQLTADGYSSRQGCVTPAAPLADAATLTPADLDQALRVAVTKLPPTLITRYEGPEGSGRTYALERHKPETADLRRVFLDVRVHTHRALLVECLTCCGASPPEGATIADLVEVAALALQSQPTLLLLDNIDAASAKCRDTLHRLLDAAEEAVMSALPPPPGRDRRDPIAALRRRAHLVELEPLSDKRAHAMIKRRAPHLDAASRKIIVSQARGNPQALMAYTERVTRHGEDERHKLEGLKPPARWLNIIVILCAIVGVTLLSRHINNTIAGAVLYGVLVLTLWYLRPIFRDMTRGGNG
jgi:hypothetical protein